MPLAKISFIYTIKYPYLVNLSTIINIISYFYLVIGSFNFSNFNNILPLDRWINKEVKLNIKIVI